MKKIEDLVPKNKYDFSGMGELWTLSDEEIMPILAALLEWMKDMNWPVAKEIPRLLARHQKVIIPYIIEILQPDQMECDWKNFIIWDLLILFDKEYLIILKPCLERIVRKPTLGEISEETNVEAQDFLYENGWFVE